MLGRHFYITLLLILLLNEPPYYPGKHTIHTRCPPSFIASNFSCLYHSIQLLQVVLQYLALLPLSVLLLLWVLLQLFISPFLYFKSNKISFLYLHWVHFGIHSTATPSTTTTTTGWIVLSVSVFFKYVF